MIVYILRVKPLIRELQEAHTKVTKHWYVDDTEAVGTFPHILYHLGNIMVRDPSGHISRI